MSEDDYDVRYRGRDAPEFGDYVFEIWLGPRKVAEVRHDFRGEDCQIVTQEGWEYCDYPFEGARPWRVSEAGRALLDRIAAKR
ncbi:hypothetical protein [Sphingosinicella sp.]|uniref:hypothetical protein n=1 Tax=Sphingosinicella sp. TaxID=1917971 RepID=UPI004037C093